MSKDVPLVGKTAPPLTGLEYVQGKKPTKGRPVVVEFWATWCGPCKTTIPHLAALYKANKDNVDFIAVSNESLDVVEKFVKANKDYTYPCAVGNLKGFPVSGIPKAFLIGVDGKVAWEGHPSNLTQQMFEKGDA